MVHSSSSFIEAFAEVKIQAPKPEFRTRQQQQARLARTKSLEDIRVEQKVQKAISLAAWNAYHQGDKSVNAPEEEEKNQDLVDQIIHKYIQRAMETDDWSSLRDMCYQPPWVQDEDFNTMEDWVKYVFVLIHCYEG
jgi:hypothetical protein